MGRRLPRDRVRPGEGHGGEESLATVVRSAQWSGTGLIPGVPAELAVLAQAHHFAKRTATLSVPTAGVRSPAKWLSGRSTFRRTHSWATRMSRLRTVLYLVAIVALLAAMFGSLASPVQADDGGNHHGDDHKGDDHKKDKPGPDRRIRRRQSRSPRPGRRPYPGTNRHSSASARSDGHVRTGTGDDTRGRAHGSARAGG